MKSISQRTIQTERLTTRLRYQEWLARLSPHESAAVFQAADWFATVHALDMDALYALIGVLEARLARHEQRIVVLEQARDA